MNLFSKIITILMILFAPLVAQANEHQESEGDGKVDVKELVFGHIGDSYSWHIIGDIAIPLPCIVYGQNGLDVFMSSKLGHEDNYTEYNGYKIAEKGQPNAGKIVEVSTGERPFDISITKNVLFLLISTGLLLWIFLSISKRYKEDYWRKPTGMQAFLEPIIVMIEKDVIEPCVGKNVEKFSPFLLTVFFFILINNYLGLIPVFGSNLTGNIACTMVLAVFTFLFTNFKAGTKHYWLEMVNPEVPTWLKFPVPLMPLIEIIGMFTKPIALCIRLFANMLAGHVMQLVLIGMIFIFAQMSIAAASGVSVLSCALVIFMTCLECLVCFIQAYVFTTLSALFIGLAQVEPHEEHK
ncbi:MAG: F0F1 ATP synthase subunit A [Paludibacteraceae bacterium]|nr:F0F1 ATP synthase subunit A [Paludibacteraceae bacterium]